MPVPAADAPVPTFDKALLKTEPRTVPPEWIDYNGHMNVAYYTMAFDKSSDQIFDDVLGIGEEYASKLRMGPYVIQQQLHYIGELLEGEAFRCEYQLLDWDRKRLHFFGEMRKMSDGALCATSETLTMNVDLTARKSADYPDWAQARIRALAEAHAHLPRPERAGAAIGIRRKG